MPEDPAASSEPKRNGAAYAPFSLTRPAFGPAAAFCAPVASPAKANPFSLSSGAPLSIGVSSSVEPFSLSTGGTAAPDAAAPTELRIKARSSTFGKDEVTIDVLTSSTVQEVVDKLRAELRVPDEDPMTLFLGGAKKCTCPTQRLLDVAGPEKPQPGESSSEGPSGTRTLVVHCMKIKTEPTAPVSSTALTPQAAAAAAAAKRAAEAAAATAAASTSNGGGTSNDSVRVRRAGQWRDALEVAVTPQMTGLGLKQELHRRGEGPVEQFRLLFGGAELIDAVPLEKQRIVKGATIDLALKMAPFKPLTTFSTSSSFAPLGGKRGKFVGLRNQGATCYLNSLLQSVYMTPDFRKAMQQYTADELPELPRALCRLFAELQMSATPVSTEAFTSTMRWGSVHRQQDVHEFWTCLCERLESELKDHAMHKLVESLFQGKQRDYVTCQECGRTSYTEDVFQDLKLVVPQEAVGAASTSATASTADTAGHATHAPAQPPPPPQAPCVASALRELLKPEKMCGDEQYYCEKCSAKVDAMRGVELRELPRVLTLQLKRFGYDVRTGQRFKVNTPFSFDATLDMGPYVRAGGADEGAAAAAPPPLLYELYAVLVHAGSASFGHYYALIKDLESSEWHEFNDSRVEPIKEADIKKQFGGGGGSSAWSGGSSAYMLLYRQRGAGAPAAPAAESAATSGRMPMGPGHVLGRGAPAADAPAPHSPPDLKRHCAKSPSAADDEGYAKSPDSQASAATVGAAPAKIDLHAPDLGAMDVDEESENPYARGF